LMGVLLLQNGESPQHQRSGDKIEDAEQENEGKSHEQQCFVE